MMMIAFPIGLALLGTGGVMFAWGYPRTGLLTVFASLIPIILFAARLVALGM